MTDIEILMQDGCTRSEAEKHLQRGSAVIGDLEEHLEEYISEWELDEDEREKVKEMIRTKKPMTDWGIVQDGGKSYYIAYCL